MRGRSGCRSGERRGMVNGVNLQHSKHACDFRCDFTRFATVTITRVSGSSKPLNLLSHQLDRLGRRTQPPHPGGSLVLCPRKPCAGCSELGLCCFSLYIRHMSSDSTLYWKLVRLQVVVCSLWGATIQTDTRGRFLSDMRSKSVLVPKIATCS